MNHFDCPHCGKRINVFDDAEAERNRSRLDEMARAQKLRSELIADCFQRLSGVALYASGPRMLHVGNAPEPKRLFVPEPDSDGRLPQDYVMFRSFEENDITATIEPLVAAIRSKIHDAGMPREQYASFKADRQLCDGHIDGWILLIDGYPVRAMMSYRFLHAGWAITLDAAYWPDRKPPIDPNDRHAILRDVFGHAILRDVFGGR